MARCHFCGKKLGLLGRVRLISERRDRKRQDTHPALVFCESCAASWPDHHKRSTLNEITEGVEPVEAFRISEVKALDPAGRTVQGSTTATADYCYGDLVFTDKGICYIGHDTFIQSSPLRANLTGFDLAAIARNVAAKRSASAESRRRSDLSLSANLHTAKRLIFFPRHYIGSIEYETWDGLKIEGRDRFWSFELPQERDTYMRFNKAISHYLKLSSFRN
jgi:hypothetical protein